MYGTPVGRVLLKLVFSTHAFSFLCGIYYNSRFSKHKINKFTRQNSIDLSTCNKSSFNSFNDFFTRKESRIFKEGDRDIISPCDGYVSAYTIDENLRLSIKGRKYAIKTLVNSDDIAKLFSKGTCLVFRLTLADYHRYIYTHSGEVLQSYFIKGRLHTVRPIENSNHNYFENTRNVMLLNTKECGKVAQIEVGAMLVGKICNHKNCGNFSTFEEKGFFEYGGSTIIILYKKGAVKIHDDICDYSKKGIEAKIQMGEVIGNVETLEHIF